MVEQAVALNPNLAIAWYSRGWVTMMCGEAERSIESFDRMIRLSPLDPLRRRCLEWKFIRMFHPWPLRGRLRLGNEINPGRAGELSYAGSLHRERDSCWPGRRSPTGGRPRGS